MLIGRYIGKRLGDISKLLFGGKKDLGIDGSPSDLAVSVVSNTQLNLSWTNGSTNEDGISVERSEDGVAYAEIYQTAAAATSYNNTGLTQNTNYYYRVRAFRGSVYSEYSDVVSAYTLTTDCFNYIDGLETPLSSAQIVYINTFIKSLYSGLSITALSQFFDTLYILAGETAESSYRNLVKRLHDATAVNSPTWTQYEGSTGDGISAYLDTNYNANSQGSNYTLNNCAFGVYIRTSAAEVRSDIGVRTDTTNYTNIISRDTTAPDTKTQMRIHSGVNPYVFPLNDNSIGMYIAARNGNTQTGLFGWKNKSVLSPISGTGNTTSIPNFNFFMLARNFAGNGEQFSTKQIGAGFTSKYTDQTAVNVITDAIETYFDAHGKGIIA